MFLLFFDFDFIFCSTSHVPKHGSREVILVVASLTTCDPGNIFTTIQALKQDKVRCSIISLTAEMHVCRALARETGGEYNVIMNDSHFREVMFDHVVPPAILTTTAGSAESGLVVMGFPVRRQEQHATLCAWYFLFFFFFPSSNCVLLKCSVAAQPSKVDQGRVLLPSVPLESVRSPVRLPDLRPHARAVAPFGALVPPPPPSRPFQGAAALDAKVLCLRPQSRPRGECVCVHQMHERVLSRLRPVHPRHAS